MNSKKGFAFSIVAIAAVIALFSSGPLVESMQALASQASAVSIGASAYITSASAYITSACFSY
ncbi:MAG: hypothetical protein WA323_02295 [Candidatus Nitrosopolaris sp.]|jgi:hypothetical protein